MERLLEAIRESLRALNTPRFFRTERGYQGAFAAELSRRMPSLSLNGAIIEEEYQKRIPSHGLRIRPDIIIHIPFEEGHLKTRREGNFVAFALKLNTTRTKAMKDYEDLSSLCEILDYQLGVFINIGSNKTFLDEYKGIHKDRIHAFSVALEDTDAIVREEHAT